MKQRSILLAGGILGAFAIAGVGLVVLTHLLTDERVATNQREAMLVKFRAILPTAPDSGEPLMDNDPLADRIQVSAPDLLGGAATDVYRVRQDGEPVALILNPVVPDGYAGPIRLLVAVKTDGTLGGVRVIDHHETPGLGDKIEERKSNWIKAQFDGKGLGNPSEDRWLVKRDGGDFDQFTGATITPRSIVKSVKNTLKFVAREGHALFAQPAASAPTASQGAKEAS
ncbi:MAG: electron transport complex subunit RsxG [Chromatiaceae bacterium]|jgi:electron transport complex protein RnfG|nr:electron transport complex subunit RsxG [Candidatus Thioaporhodococcus sediminis]